MPVPDASTLRAVTYLSPGIPRELFGLVTDHLSHTFHLEVELWSETGSSGPMEGDPDPFRAGRADLGFLCSPSFLFLSTARLPSVELVPAAFAFSDPRAEGRPVYFADVVVRAGDSAESLGELRGRTWAYNDECSLSGYFSVLQGLAALGAPVRGERDGGSFFACELRSGSHQASVDAVRFGRADAAAIDSVALNLMRREEPRIAEELRVVETLGPFPIQPVVARAGLGGPSPAELAGALLELEPNGALAAFGLERFVPIDVSAYEDEHRELVRLGRLSP